MADQTKITTGLGNAELHRVLVCGYDLNQELVGKITFTDMVSLMLRGRLPSAKEARMLDALSDAMSNAAGREVVFVSHQTPVIVTRLALSGRRLPPWISGVPCQTGSVTTIVLNNGAVTGGSYFVPTA
jgi:hypothetical protein